VLNEYDGETVAARTNPDELERMCDCPVWTVPTLSDPADSAAVAGHLPDPSAL
jgi:dethiobiotin synthetase